MIKLTWLAVVLLASGPVPGRVADDSTFKTMAECDAFADAHKDRFADWVRGNLSAGWSLPVDVAWKCEAEGRPA